MVEFGRKNFLLGKKKSSNLLKRKNAKKRVVQDGRIRTKKFSIGEKKVFESSETCKNAKKKVVHERRIQTKKFSFGEKSLRIF